MFGWLELLIVFGIVLLVFGASRIPDLAGSLGESVKEFKAGLKTNTDQENPDVFDEEDEL